MWLLVALYGGAVGLAIGAGVGYVIRKKIALGQVDSAEAQAEKIIKEAESKHQQHVLEGKDRALKLVEDSKREDENRRKELRAIQAKLEKGENDDQRRMSDLQGRQDELFEKNEKLENLKTELTKSREEQIAKLEQIAGLTLEEAKGVVLKNAALI